MKKALIYGLSIAAIMIVSSLLVFAHTGQWMGQSRGQDEGKLVTLEGTAMDVGRPTAAIKTDDGEYILHIGPLWYQPDEGYPLKTGQEVKVTGTVEEIYGMSHIYPRTIESNGKTLLDDTSNESGYCYGNDTDNDWHNHMHNMMHGQGDYGSHMMGQYGHGNFHMMGR